MATPSRVPPPSRERENGGEGSTDTPYEESALLEKKDLFESLPDEVILALFQLLPRATLAKAAQVCQRWQQIAYDPAFWRKAEFGWRDKINPGTLGSLLARGCMKLRIVAGTQFEQPMFAGRNPEEIYALKQLKIDGGAYVARMEDNLRLILSRCRALTRIETRSVAVDDGICRLIGECAHLTSVALILNRDVATCDGYRAILEGCRRLEHFYVCWAGPSLAKSRFKKLTPLNDSEIRSLINGIPPTMKNMTFFNCTDFLNDQHVKLLVSKAPLLTHLDLEGCRQLTDKALQHISQLEHLTELRVNQCSDISYGALHALSGCKSLRHLTAVRVLSLDKRKMLKRHFAGTKVKFYG